MLQEGLDAPNFMLRCTSGRYHSLMEFFGKKIVLYFYPKDETSGCVTEANGFKEDYVSIRKKNAVIIGVSPDGVQSHIIFKEKYKLPFMLLSDYNFEASKKYDAVKKFLGFNTKKIKRMTYIIDEKGKIMKIFPDVNASGHSKEILSLL